MFTKGELKTDPMLSNLIYARSVGGIQMQEDDFVFAEIRGWGHLQYLGEERAGKIQEANAKELVRRWNCHEELLAAAMDVVKTVTPDKLKGTVKTNFSEQVALSQLSKVVNGVNAETTQK